MALVTPGEPDTDDFAEFVQEFVAAEMAEWWAERAAERAAQRAAQEPEPEPEPEPPTPVELAAGAGQLNAHQARLTEVQAGLNAANGIYRAAMLAADAAYHAAAGPLARERDELLAEIRASEEAAAELDRRRARVAELRAQLDAAQAELPSE